VEPDPVYKSAATLGELCQHLLNRANRARGVQVLVRDERNYLLRHPMLDNLFRSPCTLPHPAKLEHPTAGREEYQGKRGTLSGCGWSLMALWV